MKGNHFICEEGGVVFGYGQSEASGCCGMIYHAVNRANFRSRLYREPAHYEDFLGIVEES